MADLQGNSEKETPTVITGADSFGAPLKDLLVEYLKEKNVKVIDVGVDKYYSVAVEVATRLAAEKKESPQGPFSRGLLVCGTGVGVSIFANKFGGVYAAPCNTVEEAKNARSFNNTNVLTLGGKIISPEEGKRVLDTWLETAFKAPCPASDGCPWNEDIEKFLDTSIEEMERISQAALDNGGPLQKEGVSTKNSNSGSTPMVVSIVEETFDDVTSSPYALLQHILESTGFSEDSPIQTDGENSAMEPNGRAGIGPGLVPIHAPLSQPSIVATASDIPDLKPADPSKVEEEKSGPTHTCAICALASGRQFEDVDIMPGGSWTIVREDPTSAVVRFKAGSLEPAHHHTFGHDLIVIYGSKTVWNLTTKEIFNLTAGDFLYTPAGDVHRVQYHTDTEFFIRWDGHWDILLDEDIEAAKEAVRK